eukprot:TRINITY_DN15484_c0_g1_i1.p1 TRINITY_DN15484_c0_g1~~TRINITY_DN15484_c0_g1_i1.p1  ORF type:complete len:285 (-),score=20.07 TRINITY_DN15484_c0_g1_i1:36-890(-)
MMSPRSNHTATFIPPRVAGPTFEDGFLLVFGGNVSGRASNSVDVLDLATMTWQLDKVTTGRTPTPRNSHTATLMLTSQGEQVFVAGGGSGDALTGGPPRGGRDFSDVHMLDPQSFRWQLVRGAQARGRGHCAFRLGNSLVTLGGGAMPDLKALALVGSARDELVTVEASSVGQQPVPAAFGGGCTLPDGTLFMYGGWHPFWGTFGDIWVGHVTGCVTPFCAEHCAHSACNRSDVCTATTTLKSRILAVFEFFSRNLWAVMILAGLLTRWRTTPQPPSDGTEGTP